MEISLTFSNPIHTSLGSDDGYSRCTLIAIAATAAIGAAFILTTEISFTAVVLSAAAVGAVLIFRELFCDTGPASGVKKAHMQEFAGIEANIPPVPQHIQAQDLLRLFDEINFTVPQSPDYVRRSELEEWNDPQVGRGSLERWIGYISSNTRATGTPEDETARRRFYDQLDDFLRHIASAFQQIETDLVYQIDPATGEKHYVAEEYLDIADIPRREEQVKAINARNRILINLAIGCGHCGGRVMTEATVGYHKAALGLQGNDFELKIKFALHEMRMGIVQEVVSRECPNVGSIFQSHAVVRILQHLCDPRGIMGRRQIQYSDPYANPFAIGILPQFRGIVLRWFDARYTKERIISSMKDFIDGMPSESGGRYREIEEGLVREWLRTHVPPEWQNRPLADGYQNAGEQFVYEGAFEQDARGNYLIKREAVEHLLKTLHVIY